MVAVATHVTGFDTFAGLLPAFAFHAVSSLIGFECLRAARRRGEVRETAEAAASAENA